jgi:hypothetical protein
VSNGLAYYSVIKTTPQTGNITVCQGGTSSNPFFQQALLARGVLNKDPMVWLNGAGPPPLLLLVLPMPENEFVKVIIPMKNFITLIP